MSENAGAVAQTSLGDDIRAAVTKLSADEPIVTKAPVDDIVDTSAEPAGETAEQQAQRERDEQGRFAKKKADESAAEPETADTQTPSEATDQTAAAAAPIKAPASLKPAIKARWAEIPPDIQQEFIRLESTQQKGMQKVAEDANFGRALREVVSPHEATFRALGVNAPQAVDALLKADYKLRTAHPREKAQYILKLAQQYGADMSVFQPANADGQNPQTMQQTDPAIVAMWNKLQQFEQSQQQQQTERERYEAQQVTAQLQTFAAEHEFYEDVRKKMGALMQSGEAMDLQDAYDQACNAHPDIRQVLFDREFSAREAKRKADQAKAVGEKKAAGVSIRGSGPAQVAAAAKDETVGDTIRRVMASGGRI